MTRERERQGVDPRKASDGCEAIRGWLEKSGSGVDIRRRPRGAAPYPEEPALMECFEEIFREASEPNQETILRWPFRFWQSGTSVPGEGCCRSSDELGHQESRCESLRELGSRVKRISWSRLRRQ